MHCKCPLLTQSGHFDAGPTSNSITSGVQVHRRGRNHSPTSNTIPSRESDYVRTIFISYPAQHHRSRDKQKLGQRRTPSVKYCVDKMNAKYIHGKPEPELVPSRYALKVGEIDVMVVSDGVLSLPGAMLGHNVDPAVRAAWLEDMFLPPDVLEWALNVVVVRSGGRTILIDAGMGMEFPDLPRVGRLVQRLEAAGIDLASVTDVVLTHLHMDHCWRIARRRGEGPAASGPAGPPGGRRGQVLGGARFLPCLHAAGIPGRASADGQAVLERVPEPDADVRERVRGGAGGARPRTGGHTPGHSVVRLASGGDRLTFAGDAVFQVGFEHPDWYNGFEHDPEEAARVRVRLLRELAANRKSLVATHLSFPSVCHVAVDGDVFRWVPGPWEY